MKWLKQKYLLSAVGALILVALIALGLRRIGEPRFEGRPLSRWLDNFEIAESEVRRAVRGIGTNAIPYLEKWMLEDGSWIETQVRRVNARQNWYYFDYQPTVDANHRALRGFYFLEEKAGPSIPWLVDGLKKKDNDFQRYAIALVFSGPAGRDALMTGYQTYPFDQQLQIVRAAYSLIENDPKHAGFYVQFVEDPDPRVAINAMFKIRQLKGRCPQLLYDVLLRIAERGAGDRQSAARKVALELLRTQPELSERKR